MPSRGDIDAKECIKAEINFANAIPIAEDNHIAGKTLLECFDLLDPQFKVLDNVLKTFPNAILLKIGQEGSCENGRFDDWRMYVET